MRPLYLAGDNALLSLTGVHLANLMATLVSWPGESESLNRWQFRSFGVVSGSAFSSLMTEEIVRRFTRDEMKDKSGGSKLAESSAT